MDIQLNGKRAMVTGSTAGIGFAIAAELGRSGATVVVNGRSDKRVALAVEELDRLVPGAAFTGVPGDVGTAEGVAQLIDAVPDLDVLVNNAGIFEQAPFVDVSDDEWHRFFDVNVMSGIRLSRHHAPRMAERGWGRIVFISSESALHIPKEMIHYGMTKTAQLAISRGVAETYAGTGLTVNAVLPGPTLTEGMEAMLAGEAEEAGITIDEAGRRFITTNRPTSLLGRPASAEEVANMVAYICSPAASATNGSAIRVDGGVVRAIP